jgi:nitrogen regulatory protein P-II 1
MKEIKAVIHPQRLGKLRDAFRQMRGFPGMTVSRVEGCSPHEEPEVYHDIREELTAFSPKIRIEIMTPDDKVEEIIRLIHAHAHSGRLGDGLIWVTNVENVRFIRMEPI